LGLGAVEPRFQRRQSGDGLAAAGDDDLSAALNLI
jgi:hypothetical protein